MTVPEYQHPDPSGIESALVFLAQTITDLSELVPVVMEEATDAEMVTLLAALREQRQALASIEASAEANVAAALDRGEHDVAGMKVRVSSGGSWKEWRSDDLAWTICSDLIVDDTGTVDETRRAVVDEVRSRLLNCARPSWRLTPLRDYGIDPADYASWEAGRRTVRIEEATCEQ